MLYAFREESGITEHMALKMACGLGAGMARKGEVCGAVTGGMLVLGMRYGRGSSDEKSAMELTYLKTRELMDLFAARHGSYMCRQLLNGLDLTTEAGQKQFKENDMLKEVCNPCVLSVVDILEKVA